MATRRIPIEAYPDVTQQSELDGVTYGFRFRWNDRNQSWFMDIATVDGTPIASGIQLVTQWPLLKRIVRTPRPAGELWLIDLTGQNANPTFDDFGARFALMYVEAGDA